jgi:transposase
MALRHDHEHGVEGSYERADDVHQHGAQGAGDAGSGRYRRIELITGEPKRRRWSAEEKAHITALSFAPGCNVSALARRYGVSIGLLHYWRRTAREREADAKVRFVPLVAAAPTSTALERGDADGVIEVEIGAATIRVRGRVDRSSLETVLAATRAIA